jgi:hypothetical protein
VPTDTLDLRPCSHGRSLQPSADRVPVDVVLCDLSIPADVPEDRTCGDAGLCEPGPGHANRAGLFPDFEWQAHLTAGAFLIRLRPAEIVAGALAEATKVCAFSEELILGVPKGLAKRPS